MEIILLESIDRLGGLGDLVNVRPGFARNYLLPKGKAKLATPENIAEIEVRRAELEKHEKDVLAAAKARAKQLEGLEVTITAKSGSEGKLFGSVTTMEIAEALAEKGIEVDRRKILLDQPIKTLGEHTVDIKINAGVDSTIKVVVATEDGETAPKKAKVEEVPAEEAPAVEAASEEAAAEEK